MKHLHVGTTYVTLIITVAALLILSRRTRKRKCTDASPHEQCRKIINIAEDYGTVYGWTTNRHGRKCTDASPHQRIVVKNNLLTTEQCKQIIDIAEDYASVYGWTTNRHEHYPTTDNLITVDMHPKLFDWITYTTHTAVFPILRRTFDIEETELRIHELFIVKYDGDNMESQNYLEPHTDITEFSFVIALNDNYQGGGTNFVDLDQHFQIKSGSALIFSGKRNRHEGKATTKGVRYIITGFISTGAF